MPLISRTRSAIRAEMIKTLLDRDDYILETPTSVAATTQTWSHLANAYDNAQFYRGEVRGTVAGTDLTRRVSAVTTSGLTLTTNTFGSAPTDTTVQVLRAPNSFADFDNAITRAIDSCQRIAMVDASDETMYKGIDDLEYAVPSSWVYVHSVSIDHHETSGDRWMNPPPSGKADRPLHTANTYERLSQPIILKDQMQVGSVWIPMRKTGSPTGTMTLSIQTSSSGQPSGTVVDNGTATTVLESSISTEYVWTKFTFSNPASIGYNTTYHIVLQTTRGVDATNYVAWVGDSVGSYVSGKGSAYNGSAWASETLLTRLFHTQAKSRVDYRPVPHHDWRIVEGSSPSIRLHERYKGLLGPIRLEGQRAIAEATTDASSIEADPELIHATACSLWLQSSAAANPAMRANYQMFEQLAAVQSARLWTKPRGRQARRQ